VVISRTVHRLVLTKKEAICHLSHYITAKRKHLDCCIDHEETNFVEMSWPQVNCGPKLIVVLEVAFKETIIVCLFHNVMFSWQ